MRHCGVRLSHLLYCFRHCDTPTAKFPLIADFKDSDITTRTKFIVDDYLKIDDRVLNQTNMSAFLIAKTSETIGERRAEVVYQLLQKLR